ncbi:MAG: amino acid adenylation domain-containing protein, partial [Gemmatimonadaceae bacterium]
PSQLQMVLETPGAASPQGLPRLRRLFLGGEALPSELLARVSEVCPTLPITNLYGPTECTVYSTHWSVEPGTWRGGFVPIGKPIFNTTINLVDASRQRVPIGVPGELCIGGLGLANGYLNRPELTDEKFVPDPFGGVQVRNDRLYRTGDRARYRADGTLEYMGRLDTQVKLRGFRVELGEIENALADLPDVQSAVVLVREDTPGDQRLVAYCIASDPAHIEAPTTMRQKLKASLPDFMVPSAFVWLDAWPMNANGKLDRKALPSPDAEHAATAERIAPRTESEHVVAGIWKSVLGRDVGVEDDFFEIGGHSLLALRALARITDQTGARIPLRMLFESPTVAGLARLVDAAGPAISSRIARTNADAFPLTPAQELLWLVQRTAPDNGAYNVADQWRVRGSLDADALRGALDTLVRRHAALRTVIETRNGTPMQVIRAARPVELERVDLSNLDETTAAAKAHRLARIAAARAFDLGNDQLLRVLLIAFGAEDHLLVTVTHHVAADGWSRGIMLRELSAAYATILGGQAPSVAEPELRFGDFAQWQHDQSGAGGFDAQVERWAELLAGASLTVDLPVDRPRPATPKFAGAKKTVLFPVALRDKLRVLAAEHDSTVYMVLLAAFQVLLHRISVQDDVLVQTTTAGRPRAELENIVGYFASTLPVRTRFDIATTFADVLASVREATLAASEIADVPYAALGMELTSRGVVVEGNGSQVMFVMQNNEGAALRLGNATMEARGVDAGIAKMDLSVSMGEQQNGLRIALEYRTDLFDAATAERMVSQMRLLLEGVADDATRRVDDYDIITPEERRVILERSRGHDVGPILPGLERNTVLAALAHHARTAPGHIALEEEGSGRTLTYAELAASALRIGAALRARGTQRGDVIAIIGGSTIEMHQAIWGVLAAGAAYLPLDPDAPAQRQSYLITDSRAKHVLVDGNRRAGVIAQLAGTDAAGVDVVEVTELLAHDAKPQALNALASAAEPHDLIYVMYTSGSTGQPKGVGIEHRNLATHDAWIQAAHPVKPDDTVFAVSAFTFDPSVTELFATIACAGARLLLAREDLRKDPRYVLDVLRRRPSATLESVPSILRLLVDTATEPVRGVGHLFVGGEAMPPDLPREVKRVFPDTLLHNGYGPTEATIDSMWFTLAPHTFDAIEARGVVPIGKPIAGYSAYIVERSGCLAPLGVTGELWVGGGGVSRGYLGRPDLTAEKFLPDPFAGGDARVYRTGDRVRWNSDGYVDFLGRIDDQVKIGGVRIEPGEIEHLFAKRAGVRDVAVLVRGEGAAKQLVAYVVADGVTAAELRAFARDALPAAMVPAAFVMLDEMPRNASGKLNRSALPVPDDASFDRAEWLAPRTET